ncbi:hypothetical protein GCM10023191_079070 [Actinoallomurus oryzae]|uniref:Glyoxalase-like domain-containing protein n=1 Tax=Actinoallomurus oryzae TaxID=502180 RepID=A0ABP8QXS9_9ACTN
MIKTVTAAEPSTPAFCDDPSAVLTVLPTGRPAYAWSARQTTAATANSGRAARVRRTTCCGHYARGTTGQPARIFKTPQCSGVDAGRASDDTEGVIEMAVTADFTATKPDFQPGEGRRTVLADPEGHPFCIAAA